VQRQLLAAFHLIAVSMRWILKVLLCGAIMLHAFHHTCVALRVCHTFVPFYTTALPLLRLFLTLRVAARATTSILYLAFSSSSAHGVSMYACVSGCSAVAEHMATQGALLPDGRLVTRWRDRVTARKTVKTRREGVAVSAWRTFFAYIWRLFITDWIL